VGVGSKYSTRFIATAYGSTLKTWNPRNDGSVLPVIWIDSIFLKPSEKSQLMAASSSVDKLTIFYVSG